MRGSAASQGTLAIVLVMIGHLYSGIRKLAGLWLLLAACCDVAAATTPAPAEVDATYQRFEALAGKSQESVRFFRMYYWQPISDRALVLWLGLEEPYLIDLRERCHGLRQELFLRIADFQRPGRNMLRARWSSIVTRHGHDCRIGNIRALDFSRIDEIEPRPITRDPRLAGGAPNVTPGTGATLRQHDEDPRQWATLVSVSMVPPEQPSSGAGRFRHGITHIAAKIDPDGHVLATDVLISSGHRDLDSAALEAVLGWRFEPYRSDDPDLRVWVQVPVVFNP